MILSLQDPGTTKDESRKRAIRLKSQEIRDKFSPAEILHAAMLVHGKLGNVNAKKVHKILIDNPSDADKLMEFVSNPGPPAVTQLSRIEALSFLIHHDWSENDYRYVYI